jgi:pimeloyl-ACP methyl ester carboxylesterase
LGDSFSLDNLHCGYIEVPVNHNQPGDRKIRIAYAVIKGRETNSSAGPMIYFSGGPGSSTMTAGDLKEWHKSALRDKRDLIFFDQRGVHHSSALPNMVPELFNIMAADLSTNEEYELTKTVTARYYQQAIDQGTGLENYNSFQNACDVKALMDELGYEKYNLYGKSYGAKLARIVQDMFPEKINSVILNAPSILAGDFLVSRLETYSLSLQRIFDYCRNNVACQERYPNLKVDYIQSIESLKQNPLSIKTDDLVFTVNAQDAVYLIRNSLFSSTSRETTPALIEALKNGDSEIIRQWLPGRPDEHAGYNDTMWMAVERYEQFDPKYTSEKIDSIYKTLPLLPERLGQFTSLYLAAQEWPYPYLPLNERGFKKSDIPTVIFVNWYDPVTPPQNGHILQEQISPSRLFVLDEGGHGGGNWNCQVKIMNEFMDNPLSSLATDCLNLYPYKEQGN